MTPKIAIITRTKNRTILLKRCILSVSSQTLEDYIQIIVNDGGDQEIVESCISQFDDKIKEKINIIHNSTSLGMEAASNIALKCSNSEYVTFLDDDDTWESNFLEVTTSFLDANRNEMGAATASNLIQEVIDEGKVTILHSRPYKPHIKYHTLYSICGENAILNHSFVYRRSALSTIGNYNESLPVLGDWEFNLRFLSEYDIPFIHKRLANYHIRRTDSAYGNTITKDISLHDHTRMKICNQKLRDDLKQKYFGIGFLINTAYNNKRLNVTQKINQLVNNILDSNKLVRAIRRIMPNSHAMSLRRKFHGQ